MTNVGSLFQLAVTVWTLRGVVQSWDSRARK
jgi:hypothetical protein